MKQIIKTRKKRCQLIYTHIETLYKGNRFSSDYITSNNIYIYIYLCITGWSVAVIHISDGCNPSKYIIQFNSTERLVSFGQWCPLVSVSQLSGLESAWVGWWGELTIGHVPPLGPGRGRVLFPLGGGWWGRSATRLLRLLLLWLGWGWHGAPLGWHNTILQQTTGNDR